METLSLFLLKSAAWLSGFALVYLLALRNERYFRLNRGYLLAGIVASLLFPLYTFHYAVVVPLVPTETASMGELSVGAVVADETPSPIIYFWIYLFGAVLFLSRLFFHTWKIVRRLHQNGYEQSGAVKLVRTPECVASFSFFSFVFVNPSTTKIEMEEIMNHETEHVQQRHWFDLLLVELICIVQWFNPFSWVYAHLVRQNHEFLADEYALQRTADPARYQATLLNQLMGVPVFSLTNSFGYSLNKQRFNMMKKKIDSPFRKLKMLAILPLAAMLFYAFAVPEYQYGNENYNISPDGKSIDVKGQVLKSDGNPLPGTTVILKGSTTGTMTDAQGNFALKGIPSDGELVFSFVGFVSKVQKVTGEPMKIVMEVNKVGIDQVTVVAYGTPPPPPPPPAVYLTKELNGPNPPLVLLDGVLITKEALNQVKSDQIESVNVLKGESGSALYGEKGKNGVVLIQTKGKTGSGEVVVVGYGKTPSGTTPPSSKVSVSAISAIDGTNPPLVLLDGVVIPTEEMSKVNPSEIKAVSVLKDKHATDLFGEKGKNGVILISTKIKADTTNKQFTPPPPRKNEDGVFVVVEQMPEFPGGYAALRDFMNKTVKYPAEAKDKGIQGKVFVNFVINEKGKVEKPKVVRSAHPLLDAEALRVVSLMPDWKPGKQSGKEVSVSYTIPVQFALDGGKNAGSAQFFPSVPKGPVQRPDGVYVVVDEMPKFPGGEVALRDMLDKSVKYPAEAKDKGIQGKVFISFVVKPDGTVGDAKVARGVHPLLDNEALRVVNLLPAWEPGKVKGEAVSVSYTVPVQFLLSGGKETTLVQAESAKKEDVVFVVVEEMPEFPGGSYALRNFIAREVRYPTEAQKNKIQGKVFVSFVVNSTGKVEQAKIESSVDPLLDAEAIRVINQMPDWKPGKQRGQAVNVAFTVPIEFKLQ